jgi:EmrB/QacA subfamily drug resistance transporter
MEAGKVGTSITARSDDVDFHEKEVSSQDQTTPDADVLMAVTGEPKKDWRFTLIFFALCVTVMLVALDTSIISTALPNIASDLSSDELYVWVINTYLLASTAVQPLFGQTANIFGRRSLTLLSVLLFMLGSGIAAGASNVAMMLAGRTIQGVGGGGISTMSEIVICDLVSLRERGKYAGLIGSVWAIGAVIGPILGGVFTESVSWKWIFWLNIPLSGAALALLVPFLKLRYRKEGSIWQRLARVDFAGNALLILSVVAILIALTWAGVRYPWSSWRSIVPLVLGGLGLLAFLFYESTAWCKEPTMPMQLFSNRTSVSVFLMSFFHGLMLYWACYFLPIYFQAVLGASPRRSGVMLLPIATSTAPFGIAAGVLITVTGKYRIFHYLGFVLMTIGCGLFTLLDEHSGDGYWIGFQLIFGAGAGIVFTSTLPAILASLPASEVATATATWTFMRSFGSIWGTAIPSAIFNVRMNGMVYRVPESFRSFLVDGKAYEHASSPLLQALPSGQKEVVIGIYAAALRTVWQASIAFAAIGIPLALFVKSLKLTSELDTEFGMEQKPKAKDAESGK